jgi:hypothetical protein
MLTKEVHNIMSHQHLVELVPFEHTSLSRNKKSFNLLSLNDYFFAQVFQVHLYLHWATPFGHTCAQVIH